MKKIISSCICVFLLLCGGMLSAQVIITGQVLDAHTGEGLVGVTVMNTSQKTGAITTLSGTYSISAEEGNSISFSFIGYATQTFHVAPGMQTIDVKLSEDAQELDEIVVVGASFKKSDLTGAVGSVSARTLEEKPVTTINEAIQGRVSGVFISQAAKPGDDASIKIRGTNTINTSSDPIYVVDGMVMDNFGGSFSSINVNDVASIEILKDASATALYGSRGANGVVLITTKKGKAGEGKVSYDSWVGIQTYAKTPKTMDSKQLFNLRREAAENMYAAANYEHRNDADYEAKFQKFSAAIMDPSKTSLFADFEFANGYNNNRTYDWLDEVTRTGYQQDHLLSFSGGSDKNSYYLSFGYSDNQGMVKNTSDTKYTGRVNAEQSIKPWLKVGTNTSFTRTASEIFDANTNGDYVFSTARGMNPMYPLNSKTRTDLQYLGYSGEVSENYHNPLLSLDIVNERLRKRLLTSNFLSITPIAGMNIRTSFSVDYVEEARFNYVPSDINEAIRGNHLGQAKQTRDSRMEWQWDNSITYERSFGNHKINALFSTSASQSDRDYTEVTAKDFGTDEFSYYNIGSSSNDKGRIGVGSDFTTSTLLSYLVRANYNYLGRYLLTATVRYDGSSKFAEGSRWGTFPSFSAAWNAAEESFVKSLLKEQTILDQLKVRAGFGMVGNQNIDNFAFRTLYNTRIVDGEVSTTPQGRRGTKDITWEKQQQYNAGIDLGFLNGRILFAADAFLIKNKDLLMTRSLPTSTGFKEAIENIGAIENRGVEFSLNTAIINSGDFRWNFVATLSLDKNEVTQLYGSKNYIYNYDSDRNLQKEGNLFIGESRNTLYMWKTGGIAQESDMNRLRYVNWNGRQVQPGDLYPLDNNTDGVIDDNDRVIIGSTDPKFYGGFSTDVSWKGISLNAVFSYSYGAKKLSPYYESLVSSDGKSIASADLLNNTWTPDNTDAEFPRRLITVVDPRNGQALTYNHFTINQMDKSVQDASFLRLSTLTLSYTFPDHLTNRVKLSNLRVYTTASNLFCLTPYKGYDPEMGDWYPPTRMFVFGLNVSF